MDFCRVDFKKDDKMKTLPIFSYRTAAELYLKALEAEFAADVEGYKVAEIICRDNDCKETKKYTIYPRNF